MTNRTLLAFLLLFTAQINAETVQPIERWYSGELIKTGKVIFKNNCASCHGDKAQGLHKDWKTPLEDGNYPPPPLNGTAHAWHHPISVLAHYIYNGGKKYGGVMPGFNGKISQTEAASAIAYIQSYWDDKLYQAWLDRGGMDVDLSPSVDKKR